MCDPTGEVQEWTGGSKIQRVIYQCGTVKIITTVIQRHNDHDDATQHIDGLYSAFLSVVIDEF